MSRHWIVKKNNERVWVIIYSVVGMALLMCIMAFAALSAAK